MTGERSWEFDSTLFRWEASKALMILASVPEQASDEIDAYSPMKGGFGSVRVRVTIGGSSWLTSVFPDTTRGCYIVPIKKSVRVAEGVDLGEVAHIRLELAD